MSTKPVLVINGNPVGQVGGEGGSGGHTIIDSSGSSLAQESGLQFADAFAEDDPTNGKTVVENIKEHDTKADYDQATEDGFHVCDDGEDALIGPASDDYVEVTADGVKTYAQLLAELANNADLTKITDYAFINLDNYLHKLSAKGTSFYFANEISTSNSTYIDTLSCGVINTYYSSANGTVRDKSSDVPNNGTVITLYYGNKKAVVDLQTTSNRCVRPNGETVEQGLKGVFLGRVSANGGEISVDISKYTEFTVIGLVNGNTPMNSMTTYYPTSNNYMTAYQDSTHSYQIRFKHENGKFTFNQEILNGWSNLIAALFAR